MNIKQKMKEVKDKAVIKVHNTVEWCKQNPETALAIGTMILAGGKYAVKQYNRHTNLNRTEELKTKFIYDRSYGHYWALRRKLSAREHAEIDRRRDEGEKLRDILISMRLLA